MRRRCSSCSSFSGSVCQPMRVPYGSPVFPLSWLSPGVFAVAPCDRPIYAAGYGRVQHAHDVGRRDPGAALHEHPGGRVLPEVADRTSPVAESHRRLRGGVSTGGFLKRALGRGGDGGAWGNTVCDLADAVLQPDDG